MTNKNRTKELSGLRLPELQARFKKVVGEPTRCPNKTYLIKRIVDALEQTGSNKKADVVQGLVARKKKTQTRVGKAAERADDHQVLPIRMAPDVVIQIDEARKRLGLKSRTELFRRSLSEYLARAGETEVAKLLSDKR